MSERSHAGEAGSAAAGRRPDERILVLNVGSSSLKFALFGATDAGPPLLRGAIERIGLPDPTFSVRFAGEQAAERRTVAAPDHDACIRFFLDWLAQHGGSEPLAAVGHRIVHGGPRYSTPQPVSAEVLEELRRLSPFDPEHLPAEIAWIEAIAARNPGLPQFAGFDTGFHRDLPRIARLLPIPRRYAAMGVVRYGFHGLSYASCMRELARVAGPDAAAGRIVLAHLGNGASMAAVHRGRTLDTTMGFTPMSGLPMSTRSGDVDPGLVAYLAHLEGMTADEFHQMVSRRSGLLGLSETSSDMRDLLAREATDLRAADGVAIFCYEAKKRVGAYTAALGGLDTLVFTGGIGENSASIRARICAGLDCLGIELDAAQNAAGAPVISSSRSRVAVRIVAADEEFEIATVIRHALSSTREHDGARGGVGGLE